MNYELTTDIKSATGYVEGGISHIWLLDIKGFTAYRFADGNNFFVTGIVASTPFIELEASVEACFTEDCSENVFRQKLATFIYSLSAERIENLLAAGNGKYLVLFRTRQGHFFTFGADGGASLSFSQQTGRTGEASGYGISIVKNSIYPLFESHDVRERIIPCAYRPVFSGSVCCVLQNGKRTGYKLANYAVRETAGGQAVDIDGRLCIESGRKQAILLLEGTANPNQETYEVAGEYGNQDKRIDGIPVIAPATLQCAPHIPDSIDIDMQQLVFAGTDNVAATLTSLHAWQLAGSTGVALCSPVSGKAGKTELVFSRTASEGVGNFSFLNLATQQSVSLNVVNMPSAEWVLRNGEWNEDGLWLLSGIWE
ncbi:MAG: hypothetical protein LBR34_02195 [Prevotella sp.]|nr:hypothetical protein [Prevotella sp.]